MRMGSLRLRLCASRHRLDETSGLLLRHTETEKVTVLSSARAGFAEVRAKYQPNCWLSTAAEGTEHLQSSSNRQKVPAAASNEDSLKGGDGWVCPTN